MWAMLLERKCTLCGLRMWLACKGALVVRYCGQCDMLVAPKRAVEAPVYGMTADDWNRYGR